MNKVYTVEELENYTTDDLERMSAISLAYQIMVDGDNAGLSATFDGPPETPNAVLFNQGLGLFLEACNL